MINDEEQKGYTWETAYAEGFFYISSWFFTLLNLKDEHQKSVTSFQFYFFENS